MSYDEPTTILAIGDPSECILYESDVQLCQLIASYLFQNCFGNVFDNFTRTNLLIVMQNIAAQLRLESSKHRLKIGIVKQVASAHRIQIGQRYEVHKKFICTSNDR